MRIGHIELFVENPLQSKKFYEEVLGFTLVSNQADEFIWLQCGNVEILLRPGQTHTAAQTYQSAGSAIVLYTDSVAETAQKLRERGLAFKGTDGSPDCLVFTDPDGHWFQLVNPNHP